MLYASEESFSSMLEAFAAFNQSVIEYVKDIKRDAWIKPTDACAVAGVNDAKLRRLANAGVIRTVKTNEQRGRLYKLSDCEQYRMDNSESIMKKEEGSA